MKDFIIKYKFLLLIVFIVLVFIFIFTRKHVFYVINDTSIFVYDKKWSCITELNEKKFSNIDVFSDNDFVGNFNIKYDDYWNFNKEIDGSFFGGSKGFVSLISSDMSYDDGTIDSYISSYLSSREIVDYGDVFLKRFFEYDFDSDGELELLIEATNYNSLSYTSVLFSSVFLYDNGEFYDISFNVTDDISDLLICNVKNIFNINNDSSVEYIVSCGNFSQPDSYKDSLYSYNELLSFCN